MNPKKKAVEAAAPNGAYQSLVGGVASVIEDARRTAARSVNAAMTAAYWLIGRHILEFEQGGRDRGEYGGKVVERLAADLSRRYGRGFSFRNLWQMRAFYIAWPVLHPEQAIPEAADRKLQTVSAELGQAQKLQAASGESLRQLDRQINSQFYERTALSKDKAKMLRKGERAQPADAMPPEAAIKDPFVLEFLNLKDEYSESDLEEALIRRLESFLMELGGDFCFIGRQTVDGPSFGRPFQIEWHPEAAAMLGWPTRKHEWRSLPPGGSDAAVMLGSPDVGHECLSECLQAGANRPWGRQRRTGRRR